MQTLTRRAPSYIGLTSSPEGYDHQHQLIILIDLVSTKLLVRVPSSTSVELPRHAETGRCTWIDKGCFTEFLFAHLPRYSPCSTAVNRRDPSTAKKDLSMSSRASPALTVDLVGEAYTELGGPDEIDSLQSDDGQGNLACAYGIETGAPHNFGFTVPCIVACCSHSFSFWQVGNAGLFGPCQLAGIRARQAAQRCKQ